MIYTPTEYSKKFLFKGKEVSAKTITRRCEKGMLPSGHFARKLPGETGGWVIEVPDVTTPKIVITKTNPAKPDIRTMNRKYFNFR
jgi:hypothetical protein